MKQLTGIIVGSVLLILLLSGASLAQERASSSRGYLTTPQELTLISQKAKDGIEPYKSAVAETMVYANKSWSYNVPRVSNCSDADNPAFIDETQAGLVYAKALAYHLTGNESYAAEVKNIIAYVIANAEQIDKNDQQCRLNFSWGTPEYIAAADLIEDYWKDMTCVGPVTTKYKDLTKAEGNCKQLFQNWLVKNPYFVISPSAQGTSNWGAAASTATAYIADYLWDRPEVILKFRNPKKIGGKQKFNAKEAFKYSKQLLLERMNGYAVDYHSSTACDLMGGSAQNSAYTPVKSQITERGILPDDARREQQCNIPVYNGEYQNYPQIHLNNTIQQCELLLRRGDDSCFKNIDNTDIPDYHFTGPDGNPKVTHLYPGRGSIERAINAIIIDSRTEWKHDNGLHVAYSYYILNSRFGQVSSWRPQLNRKSDCSQGICFGKLTHGFADYEMPTLPPTVPKPGKS